MDPGAAAELTIGNNMMAAAEQRRLELQQKKTGIQQAFDKERRDAGGEQADSELKEGGSDVLTGAGGAGTLSRVTGSIAKASRTAEAGQQYVQGLGAAVKRGQASIGDLRRAVNVTEEATRGMTADQIVAKASGTVGTFLSGGHQLGEAGEEVNRIGDLITQAKTGVLNPGAEKGAGVGIPAIISKLAQKVNVGEARADAVGDLVGHGVGIGMAAVSGVEDIAGGWSKLDTGQKWGNALGIAGGIVDTAGTFIPALAPVGLALDVGSAVANWIGDSKEASFQDKNTINPAQQKADAQVTKDAGSTAATSVTSTGQIAMGPTQSIATRTY
jgi:hypothetical protein